LTGNIFESPLRDILAADHLREWRTTVPFFCKDCNRFEACLGGCRAAAEQVGQTLASADPVIRDNPCQSPL